MTHPDLPQRRFARQLHRRRFLSTAGGNRRGRPRRAAMPYLSRAADRPQITHGVQSGDVGADGGVVWARADRPSQMMVEVCHHRIVRQCAGLAADRGPARERLHRQNAAGEPAGRAGHLLSRQLPRPVAYRRFQRAGGRPLPHRAGGPPRRQLRLGRRCRRARLGHQSRRRRHGHLRHHAQAPAGFPAAFRRHHLCRRHHLAGGETADGKIWKNITDSGKGQGRRDARRIPRRAQIQFPRR